MLLARLTRLEDALIQEEQEGDERAERDGAESMPAYNDRLGLGLLWSTSSETILHAHGGARRRERGMRVCRDRGPRPPQ